MKRTLAVLLGLTLCLSFALSAMAEQTGEHPVGSFITFGSYEQDNKLENGKEPVEWLVLKVDGSKVLLISKYCLDARAYNTAFVRMTWSKCTLRAWLNDTFLNEVFSANEQAMLVSAINVNDDNPHYGTYGGDDTEDMIFFLSLAEVYEYFPEQADRQAQPTAYAIANGAFVNASSGNGWWWLRTPGVRQIDVCGVSANGVISGYGSRDVNRPSGSIRPVLWVDFGK